MQDTLRTPENQPARQENANALVAYFKSGIKNPEEAGRLGVELEHQVVNTDMSPVHYSEEFGVEWLLEQLAEDYPQKTYDQDGDLIGVARKGAAVTLEPAGQVELSAGPYEGVGEVRLDFEMFERQVSSIWSPKGKRMLSVGYNPTATAPELDLAAKTRYQMMDAHFAGLGDWGRRMMRATASTQISIDYFSVEDCLRKLRLAFACVPLFALITDNTAVFEGKPRPHKMMRTEVWQKCDPARCGIVPGVMSPHFTLEDYAAYILDTPAILVPDGTGWRATEETFGQAYATTPMEKADVEHALSMFFTDVRLKNYIEIRPADSMPTPHVTAYAALIKGLFYNQESLDALDELFSGVTENDIVAAKESLMANGFDGEAYGRPAGELAQKLLDLAHDALEFNEQNYLSPLQAVVKQRKTLADLADRRR